jgi:imidazolonepropionase-like amidohydrolase
MKPPQGEQAMSQAPFYIFNARLIDGSGEDRGKEPHALLINGPRIEAVEPQRNMSCPEGTAALDVRGATVMPGMIDCHEHMATMPGGMRERANIPQSLAVLKTAEILRNTQLGGFTGIRDAGGLDIGVKLAAEQGLIPSPRLKISVNILCQTGGHNCHIELAGVDSDYPRLPGLPHHVCDGPDQCRGRTREMILAGADWIKLCTTGGISTRIGGPLVRQFSLEEVLAIADTAHAAGKPVMCHAYGGDGADIALAAKVDSIEHGAALTDEQIELMAEQRTWLVPTFSVLRKVVALDDRNPGVLPEYIPRKARALLSRQRLGFAKALASGVRIALGTDAGGIERGRNADELEYMVEAGMTPMQAILAGTRMAAQCMGLEEVGQLRPGMLADLLAVEGDPLQDVTVLQHRDRLQLIMQDGKIIKNTL